VLPYGFGSALRAEPKSRLLFAAEEYFPDPDSANFTNQMLARLPYFETRGVSIIQLLLVSRRATNIIFYTIQFRKENFSTWKITTG
jgi:hypothetical protein